MAGSAAVLPTGRRAMAQDYPVRPVRVVVGYAAGGPTDIAARVIGQWLSERLGQQFVIENRPGATGNIGTEAVVNAAPDGYTLLVVAASNAINTTLYQKLSFLFHRDTAPVAGIIRVPNVLEVTPSFPAHTVPEFIAYAKANPGKINFASGGNGTSQHVSGELFKMMAGVDMLHVPYRGSAPALTDLIAGHVQVMFDAVSSSIAYIRAGQVRALAVTTATRLEALPDLPTVGDFVPGYEASAWFGVCAPKNTPAEIIDRLNRAINAGLADPGLKARLADLGGTPLPGTPADFGKLILAETEKWAKVVKFSGARAD
jgi:tripartite-type tricarboxylate transporter receptor subunit TctC